MKYLIYLQCVFFFDLRATEASDKPNIRNLNAHRETHQILKKHQPSIVTKNPSQKLVAPFALMPLPSPHAFAPKPHRTTKLCST